MRTVGAVYEIHVDEDGLAVAASANRNLAVHLVEVQRLGAFVTGGPAHGLAGPWRDVVFRLDPGGRDLGDLLDRCWENTVGYEEDVAAEACTLVPGSDLGDDPGGRDQTAAGHVAVLGGGFIGCEVAAAAIRLGKRATILEALPTLLHRALGPELGDVVAGLHRDEGVDVRTGQQVLGIRPRRGGVRISTAAGDVDADVLVVGVGTVPNTELAEQAGLPAGHGIEVDECFATAAPGIYAIGDVAAQHLPGHGRRVRVEHHDTAIRHGRVAARNMAGQREPFADVHWFWSDQYDHTISSAGLIPGSDGPGELVIRGSLEQRSFSAFSLDGDRVRAVISLNRPRDVLDARRLIARNHSATAAQLCDESLPLKRLAAPAVTAT